MATLGMPLLGMGQETPTLTSLLTARREREKQSKLADLLANAYGTQDESQRQQYVQEAIRTDPQAGIGLAKLLDPRFAQNGTPAGLAEFQALTKGLPEDDVMKARRVRLGLDPRQSSAAIGYQKVTGPDGREYLVATDPRGVGATTIGGGPGFGTFGGQQQPMQAPDKGGMEADIALANQLAQAGFDPDKIDAFLANRGRMAEQQTAPQGMNPFAGPTPQETAYAKEAGQQRAQIDTLAQRGQIEAQNAAARERAVADAKPAMTPFQQAQLQMKAGKAKSALSGTVADLDRMASAVQKVLRAPGLGRITGVMGAIPDIPGSDAANARADLDALKSQIGFAVLQKMRSMSPTGGALGSVSDAEGRRLEANLASLDTAQSESQLRQRLSDILDYIQSSKSNLSDAYSEQFGGMQQPQRPAASGGVDDLLSKYGVK